MKGFSADATIFLFCPWKREKNALKRWSYLAPFFFSKLPWAAHRAKNWKSLSEIGLRHPLLYLLCGAHSLLVKWWFYIFFPPLIDAFFELMKSSSTTTITYLTSSYLLRKGFDFLFSKMKSIFFRKVFDFLFSKMKTYYIFTKVTNVWSIKIRTTHNLSLWLYKYVWIILLYGHLVYFILKVLTWKFVILNEDLPKKVIIKSEKKFMNGSNFYGSDFMYWKTTVLLLNNGWFHFSRLARTSSFMYISNLPLGILNHKSNETYW